jgi:hypothetical protein
MGGSVPNLWYYWEVEEPLRGVALWEEDMSLGCAFGGDIGTLPCLFLFFSTRA